MKLKTMMLSTVTAFGMGAATLAVAQNPGVNTSPYRHPNINAAQRATENAIGRLDAAQRANEYDMGGHAQRAKELLMQADQEMKQAAIAANRNR